MIKSILAAAILSLGVVSVALPHTEPRHLAQGRRHDRSNSGQEQGIQGQLQGRQVASRQGARSQICHSHRYRYAPKGWRHYGYRPYRWEHRGCIVLGNIWYCP